MLLPPQWETPVSGVSRLLGTRGWKVTSQSLESPKGGMGRVAPCGPSPGLSSKGLIWPLFGGGGRGGLGTSSKRPGGWEQWGHCGRTGVRADCWHSQPAPRGGPSPSARCSALSPRYRQRPTHPPSPLTSPARPKPLAPAAPGGPSSSAHVDIQTAVTLQEAGACGPGRGGGGD